MTAEGLPGPLTELDPAALAAVGATADETRTAEAARNGLHSGTLSVSRGDSPNHLTSSCLLLARRTPTWSVALALHAASRQWRQFGGHLESSDRTLRDAAVRELREESGIDAAAHGTWFSPTPIAVREFSVGSPACESHLDVLFAAVTDIGRPLTTDDRGVAAVAWWGVDELPADVAEDLRRDLPVLLKRVRRLLPQ